jgi:hypothetical protein
MFTNATREDTAKKVASSHGMVRWDLLKRGIQALSKSPEAYLAIRAQFARTLSTFNVASYIIGTTTTFLFLFTAISFVTISCP